MEQPVEPEPPVAGDTRLPAFATLARRGEPPFDELLLALASEFRWVDRPRALERLDELGRQLFGLAALDPERRAERLAAVLGPESGFEARRLGSATVFLDRCSRAGAGIRRCWRSCISRRPGGPVWSWCSTRGGRAGMWARPVLESSCS